MDQNGRGMAELGESKDQMMRVMEAVPTQAYWGLAVGSVVFSAMLYIAGRRTPALFVGQWPPTFLALALLYKLLRPSREGSGAGMAQATREAAHAIG